MRITKATLKKQLDVDDDEPIEVIDFRMQVEITSKDSYEDIRMRMHTWLDKRFSKMFNAEMETMPGRVEEGRRWRQMNLFDDPLSS
jgi:hypothetical protein